MEHDPDLGRWDEEEDAASLARAEADIVAGRVYSHAIVAEWMETWGKPGRTSFREWLAQRGG